MIGGSEVTDWIMGNECITLQEGAFLQELFNRLYDKRDWCAVDGSLHRLKGFIAALAVRAGFLMKNGDAGILLNRKKNRLLLNSGLLDVYCNDILLVFEVEDSGRLHSPAIVGSRKSLIHQGFSGECLKEALAPVNFFDKKSDLILMASIEEFDLEDEQRLFHILEERLYRFPEWARQHGVLFLYSKLKSSLEFALRMCRRDYKYASAMYNLRRNRIQFLLPYYLRADFLHPPELAMIIDRDRGYHLIKTVIPIDEAYGNSLVLSNVASWLQTNS